MPSDHHINDRIEELSRKKAQIDAQITALDARRRLARKKEVDRLKWILGNLVFDHLKTEPCLEAVVRRELPKRLTKRDVERRLLQVLFPDDREGSS